MNVLWLQSGGCGGCTMSLLCHDAGDVTGTLHARHIVTNHGWKISLDRGLDIFQHYATNDAFTFANRLQQYRPCKAFEVTFIKSRPG